MTHSTLGVLLLVLGILVFGVAVTVARYEGRMEKFFQRPSSLLMALAVVLIFIGATMIPSTPFVLHHKHLNRCS